ncbi:MAG: N-formylglutamate amidohydrolase [Mangrovicoccus sp.]|nr:N-formylglutamate amidohydrolase [Mangrovicoccus sp.]
MTHVYETIGADRPSRWVISCDHASNAVPSDIGGGSLGLSETEMGRHIAYDLGAAGVTRALAEALDAPAVLSKFSRLVIDPNRGEDDPTLVMKLYDGTIVPGNRHLDAAGRQERIERYYRPYHTALAEVMAAREDPILVAVHSFTPKLIGRSIRPWQIGVLHAEDARLAAPFITLLRNDSGFAAWVEEVTGAPLCVGENEPYAGHLPGDAVDRHGLQKGRMNVLIELRHDVIETQAQQIAWGQRLADLLTRALGQAPASLISDRSATAP